MVTITALNGRLPDAMLTVADTGPRGPQRLRLDAAASIARAHTAGAARGCLRSGYRTRADQADEVARAQRGETPSAAPVGRSYHGEGTAGDWDEPMRSWLRAHPDHGWRFPLPAEPWHGEYDPTLDHHPTPDPEEDDPMLIVYAGTAGTYLLSGGLLLGLDADDATELTAGGMRSVSISRDRYLEWASRTAAGVLIRDTNGSVARSVGGAGFVPITDPAEYARLVAQGLPVVNVDPATWGRLATT